MAFLSDLTPLCTWKWHTRSSQITSMIYITWEVFCLLRFLVKILPYFPSSVLFFVFFPLLYCSLLPDLSVLLKFIWLLSCYYCILKFLQNLKYLLSEKVFWSKWCGNYNIANKWSKDDWIPDLTSIYITWNPHPDVNVFHITADIASHSFL